MMVNGTETGGAGPSAGNGLKVFDNPEFGRIRTIAIHGEPWFVGRDIVAALGYVNTKEALKEHVNITDKIMGSASATPSVTDSLGRLQYPTWVNESGMYSLILSSKLGSAKRFKHWVTSEVLPTIAKTGRYLHGVGVTGLAETNPVMLTIDSYIKILGIISLARPDNLPLMEKVLGHMGLGGIPPAQPPSNMGTATRSHAGPEARVGCTKDPNICYGAWDTPFDNRAFRQCLLDRRISCRKFAAMVGCYGSLVTRWAGKVRPTEHYRKKICDALGVPQGHFNVKPGGTS